MFFRKKLDADRIPAHIGFIMDGNGRWAKKRGLPRSAGHSAGINNLSNIINYCDELGVKYVTVYAFSTENWKRPSDEVETLFNLLREYFTKHKDDYKKKNRRFLTLGDLAKLPADLQEIITQVKTETSKCTGLTVNVCLNYGGRQEIVRAVNMLLANKAVSSVDEESFSKYMWLNIPDPDLIIRTSGEKRLSNFMLYQLAYSEIYFDTVYWPSFSKKHLYNAIIDFQSRHRRKGGL